MAPKDFKKMKVKERPSWVLTAGEKIPEVKRLKKERIHFSLQREGMPSITTGKPGSGSLKSHDSLIKEQREMDADVQLTFSSPPLQEPSPRSVYS